MADGTHVWSVVAGWLEPEGGGGFIWDGGGSEDNNKYTHIFINTQTHSHYVPLINHQCFTTVHPPVTLEVVGGRWSWWMGYNTSVMGVNFIFSFC